MSFDHLWAGWRADYVATVVGEDRGQPAQQDDNAALGEANGCVFCAILASSESDEKRGIVAHGEKCVAILNAFPYASGHMLVMPIRHTDDFVDLSAAESQELWSMTIDATRAARTAYGADGLNVGANLGRAAGAGIPAHLHLHVVPRWIGDTNFMTAVASVRVMPEALSTSWRKLSSAWPH